MYKTILVPMALDHGIAASTLAAAHTLLPDGGSITASSKRAIGPLPRVIE